MITTDGQSDYPEIVEDDLGAVHHWCNFYFIKNGEKSLRTSIFKSVRYPDLEKFHSAIVWSELKSVFAAPSYEGELRRFEAVLDKIEHLPSELRTYVEQVMENFDKFAVYLRDESVPSTTNNLERSDANQASVSITPTWSSVSQVTDVPSNDQAGADLPTQITLAGARIVSIAVCGTAPSTVHQLQAAVSLLA